MATNLKRVSMTALILLALAGLVIAGGHMRSVSATGLVGDANCDGNVDSIDAALALQYSAGLVPSLPCMENADVNGDGSVNSIDGALVLQYVAGLLPSLGPPQASPTPTPTGQQYVTPPGLLTCYWGDYSVDCSGPNGNFTCVPGGGFFNCSSSGVSISCEGKVDLSGAVYLECYYQGATHILVDFTCDNWAGNMSDPRGTTFTIDCTAPAR